MYFSFYILFQGAFQKAAGTGSNKGADIYGGRDRPVPKERRH